MTDNLEAIAATLDSSEDYRVLRRMSVGSHFATHQGESLYKAVYLDLETTGLNPDADEIIEIGMVPFTYGVDGKIYSVDDPISMLREPSFPISPEATKINNITNDMVHGKTIDPDEAFAFVQHADLIIAHNAGFDRVFLEKFAPAFADKPWACSMSQVAWKGEGFDGTRLSHIASRLGFFYDAHRAVEDCYAGIEVLSRTLPATGELAMAQLLTNARKPTKRIWAVGSPFDSKDILKARGYRWNDGSDGRNKAWYLDVGFEAYEAECHFLEKEIYQREINLPITTITALERFSERA
jgi:DNA polymerase-3 subunit epsilon